MKAQGYSDQSEAGLLEDAAATTTRSVTGDDKAPWTRCVTKSSFARGTGGKVGSSLAFVGLNKISEGVRNMRSVFGVPEAPPEPGGARYLNVDISVLSDLAGTEDVGPGGDHWQAPEEVCIAVANALTVLQVKLVSIRNFH